MKRFLMRAAILGALAMAGATVGGTAAMADNCMGFGGGTDCPLTPGVPLEAQRDYSNPGRQPEVVNPGWNNHNPGWNNHNPGWNHDRRGRNGWNRHHNRVYVDRFVPVYPPSYYNDDDYYQPRYRVYDDTPRRRVLDMSQEHVDWCYDHYKTYRASDNTYKKTLKKRVQCISPYS